MNRSFSRRGPVLAERYHLHLLKTPREVRNALRYVLLNAARHMGRSSRTGEPDRASSGRWFDGWKREFRPEVPDHPPPVAPARGFMLRTGWRRWGLIDPLDVPGR